MEKSMKSKCCYLLIITQSLLWILMVEHAIANENIGNENIGNGTLLLTILDADSIEVVPARIEVINANRTSYIAEDALLIGGDCGKVIAGILEEETYDGTLENALSHKRFNYQSKL